MKGRNRTMTTASPVKTRIATLVPASDDLRQSVAPPDALHIYFAAQAESPIVNFEIDTTDTKQAEWFRLEIGEMVEAIIADPETHLCYISDAAGAPDICSVIRQSEIDDWVERVVEQNALFVLAMHHG
jgi:hypothetical protein